VSKKSRPLARPKRRSKALIDWQGEAERLARRIFKKGPTIPGLKRLAGTPWSADIQMVGAARMIRLNAEFRGKSYATDVLSFPAPEVFQRQGHLGELVICVPTMLRQARELGHGGSEELQVLLVHGILHLLGFDHELGGREATAMALMETRLLRAVGSRARAGERLPGLIQRSESAT
jgi:rRNA maturation RNase YbeY